MFSVQRFRAVARKEFLELKRDRLFFLMTIMAPVVLYFLFAYGFPLGAKNISMDVVDYDKTSLSRSLIDNFQNATELFNVKNMADNYAPAENDMDLGRIRLILVIPEDFSRDIKKGVPVNVQVLVDGTYTNVATLIGNYAEAVVADYQAKILAEYFVKKGGAGGGNSVPIDLTVSAWYNPSFRSEDFIIPGVIAIIIMFFPPVIGAISLAKEKETGSILNMYCSCLNKSEYLLGKMTPYIIISYLNLIIFIALTVFLFNVPFRGSLALVLLISPFYVATAIGLGLFIAVLVSTQVAAITITFVATVMPAFLYTGFMVPVSNMGPNAAYTSYCLPATYYIDMLRKIMVKGVGFTHVRTDVIMLIVYCLVLYWVCIRLFKKKVG